MPTDPKSGTVAEVAASKKRVYRYYEIELGSGRKDVVAIRGDAAEYFGMGDSGADGGQNYKVINRATTGRELFVDLDDKTGKPSETSTTNKYALPKQLSTRGGGKYVVVPTEMKTTKGNTRTVRLHFPAKATLAAVSNFLSTKCTTRKPSYFVTRNGVRRAVVTIPVGEINPGEDTPAPTPTA
jgi:hypothetical protein